MDQNYNNQNNQTQNNQYAETQQYAEVQPATTDKSAIVTGIISLVLGIVSLVSCYLGWAFGIAGIILSNITKKKQPDNSKAKVGFILSLIGTILGAISFVVYIILVAVGSASYY